MRKNKFWVAVDKGKVDARKESLSPISVTLSLRVKCSLTGSHSIFTLCYKLSFLTRLQILSHRTHTISAVKTPKTAPKSTSVG